jgi:hypothetical protein
MLVVGIPNVGKSTIINGIRLACGKKKAAKTGASPGVTRALSGFSVCDDPPAYLVDTPGVMLPGNLTSSGYAEEEDMSVKERVRIFFLFFFLLFFLFLSFSFFFFSRTRVARAPYLGSLCATTLPRTWWILLG